MQLDLVPTSVFKAKPPPLWYVTNGECKVGPVHTGRLVRGVEHGRVPDSCWVSPQTGDWRALLAVREIAALYGRPGAVVEEPDFRPDSMTPRQIRDDEQFSHTLTGLALSITGAESAMFHFRRRAYQPMMTRAVVGAIPTTQLGQRLSAQDLVFRSALQGHPVHSPPYGPVEAALSLRFIASEGGVGAAAMIPFFTGDVLVAMLELSRPGHSFRRADLQRAERVVQRGLRSRAG